MKKHRTSPIRSDRFAFEPLEDRRMMAVIYDDGLAAGWQNWSWDSTVDLANTAIVQSGSAAASVRHDAPWAGFYLSHPTEQPLNPNHEVRFQIHGGAGGQQLRASIVNAARDFVALGNVSPAAGQWTEVTFGLPEFTAPETYVGFVLQEFTGSAANTYYVDQIEVGDFLPDDGTDPLQGPAITINPNVEIGEISEGVYGLNFADPQLADDIDLPVNRWGGNSTTRFNYQLDATNLASDFFFENYPNDTADVSQLPLGNAADLFVEESEQVGADTIMTVGMVGWTPNSREIKGSFPVDIYGPQQEVNMYRPNHGNGVLLDGSFVQNDPTITSNQIDESFATDWVNHLKSQHGSAANGGVRYYALDNEPMLWNSTHRDVHPEPASYDQVRDKGISYATAIKQADPDAQVLGPVSWGWTSYFYSALDAAGEGAWWNNPQDRNAHGGVPFLPWYLSEMQAAENATGTRLLDYLDIHYYPQGDGIPFGPAGDVAMQEARLQSTRSLWDPNYIDPTWINDNVRLVPRMKEWIDQNYPGTKLAITEYNFGAIDHINGALTQADVLGIFGREGVDLATMWGPPDADDPAGFAFRMYRNYDGAGGDGSKFGDTSLDAETTDVDQVSVFASRRDSDGALTVMLVNKTTDARTTPLTLSAEYGDAAAEVYTYDATNLGQIVRGDDVMLDDGQVDITLPAYSITLLELPPTGVATGDFNADGMIDDLDIDALCSEIRSNSNSSGFDLNADGAVNGSDMDEMIFDVVGTIYADANLDRTVDASDFNAWNSNKFTNNVGWSQGNFNCDGVVDASDFNVWNLNKFSTADNSLLVFDGQDTTFDSEPLDASNESKWESVWSCKADGSHLEFENLPSREMAVRQENPMIREFRNSNWHSDNSESDRSSAERLDEVFAELSEGTAGF